MARKEWQIRQRHDRWICQMITMKKFFLFSLSAFLLLCGCSSTAADPGNASESAETGENAEPVAIDPDSGESELETMALTKGPKTGTDGAYISVKSSYSPFEPSLMLYSDWTFEFTENIYVGLLSYRGDYTVMGDYVICAVKEQDYPEYAPKAELRFKIIGDYLLQSEQDMFATATGDLFVYVNQANAAGTYTNIEKGYFVEGLEPNITFHDDGTFEMTENLLAGMGEYKGIWLYDGNMYLCKVNEISFSGFAGDSVKTISFRNRPEGGLYLSTDLCGSRVGHVFEYTVKPDGSKPEETAKPEERKGTVFIVAGADSNRIKVRNGPGLSAADTGERKYSGDKVTVYEEVSKDGYTWYRIGTDKWMAGNGTSFGIKFE